MTEEEWAEMQEIDVRTVTVDIEVDDRGDGFPRDGEERILSIVAHDSYSDETVGFVDLDGRRIEDTFPDGAPDNVDELHCQDSERKMLIDFRSWFGEVDPDLISGWNVADFDMSYLLQRMQKLRGVAPEALAPLGWAGVTSRGEPRIKGRTIYDSLTVYKRNSFTELRSYSLDDVAREELGAEKIQFTGSYFDLYENDTEKFIEYNARDTNLTARINDEADVIQFRDLLRREVGVDFEDSYENKDFVEMMCRRKLNERGLVGPTAPDYGDEPDSDYEGAFVFDAYEGVAENVVGIDLASLYPYTMAMLNASPETKLDGAPDEFTQETPACVAANDQTFRLDEAGLFKSLVDDAISLKSDYKESRRNADDAAEYEKWDKKYKVAKTITNSIYGVSGWERFFLYDEAVAEAVTLTGQAVIKRTAKYVESQGYEVLYGDTDSTYIKFPDGWDRAEVLAEATTICENLNEDIYPTFAEEFGIPSEDNLWDIEVEAYMERYFQAGKKKRYAYLATWKDGHDIEPEVSIAGFETQRSDVAELTSETQSAVLDAILHGREDEVGELVYGAAQELGGENVDWEYIGIPGGLGKGLTDVPAEGEQDNYYTVSCNGDNCYPQDAHPRAAWNANRVLDVDIGNGDKPMRVYLEPTAFEEVGRTIDVIAYESAQDIEPFSDELRLDVPRMTETLIKSPLHRICRAVGVDVDAAVRGQEQTGLGAF
jgi:DNA polymerase I